MGNTLADLDLLIPEDEVICFTGTDDGKRYEVKMFIPVEVGLVSIRSMHDKKKEVPEANIEILEVFLKEQYEHMDKDWIKKNISIPRQNYISNAIFEKINPEEDVDDSGESSKKK